MCDLSNFKMLGGQGFAMYWRNLLIQKRGYPTELMLMHSIYAVCLVDIVHAMAAVTVHHFGGGFVSFSERQHMTSKGVFSSNACHRSVRGKKLTTMRPTQSTLGEIKVIVTSSFQPL
jgi:hypothetical protein